MKNQNTAPMKPALLKIEQLRHFEGHPYKVQDNEEMAALSESIRENGILSPLIVRPTEEKQYEIISGHRRLYAARKAGLTEVPVLICALDRDAAAIALVDSNLHREHILPSEKAFAYRLKAEALKHQGRRTDLTLGQAVPKSEENRTTAEIGAVANESYKTVQRYIRLTHLIPELLEKILAKQGKYVQVLDLLGCGPVQHPLKQFHPLFLLHVHTLPFHYRTSNALPLRLGFSLEYVRTLHTTARTGSEACVMSRTARYRSNVSDPSSVAASVPVSFLRWASRVLGGRALVS